MFLKVLYLVIVSMFAVAFTFNFILNLIRELKSKKKLKTDQKEVIGRVREVQQGKNRFYVTVEFRSPHNNLLLSEVFEIFESDEKLEDYPIGKEVTLIYQNLDENKKKIRLFPVQLKDKKIKMDKSAFFLNLALMGLGLFIVGNTVFQYIQTKAFTSDVVLVDATNGIFQNYLYIFLMIVIYFVLTNYLISSLLEAPKKDIQNYLKFYGNVAKARVVTFKFGRSKNSKGNKESLIELEYSTNTGEQIKTKLSSFMYTETQEEYIDIIYDPVDPKTVVYVRL